MAKICPNEITDYLTANFTEDETEWLVGSVFNYGDEIRDGHYIYKYAGDNGTNTTDRPSIEADTQFADWTLWDPTNYYAMLDGETGTQTLNTDSIEITIDSLNYNTISLLEVIGTEVILELTSGGIPVYNVTINLIDARDVSGETSYWFEPFSFKPSIYLENLPFVPNGILSITINNTGGNAGCGRLIHGRNYTIGETLYNSSLGLESYSRKSTDEFGKDTLVQVDSVNLDTHEVLIATNFIPELRRKMQELDAIPILFIMDESSTSNTENLLNFGFWETFNIGLSNPSKSVINLTIKGIL